MCQPTRCRQCKRKFMPEGRGRWVYCSEECRALGLVRQPASPRPCQWCGTLFVAKGRGGRWKYCSARCAELGFARWQQEARAERLRYLREYGKRQGWRLSRRRRRLNREGDVAWRWAERNLGPGLLRLLLAG